MKDVSPLITETNSAVRGPREAAAYWHGVFDEGVPDAAQRERFEDWLAADPTHRAAYAWVERAWTGMASAGTDDRILAMRRAALKLPRRARPRWLRPAAIVAGVVAVASIIGAFVRHIPFGTNANTGEYATQVGERSSITLTDGSTVVLDTDSRMKVSFDPQVRRIRLLAGQAWFEVAKGQARPFIVEAGDRRVTAHGTAFDVRLEGENQLLVTLIEGRVSVDAFQDGGTRPNVPVDHQDLLPGDQLIVTGTRRVSKRKADVTKVTSWREGQIIFDDDTLAAAVAEINRYSAKKIVLAEPHLASLRMSGVFIAGHSDSFVETVTGHFPIKVISNSAGELVLSAAN